MITKKTVFVNPTDLGKVVTLEEEKNEEDERPYPYIILSNPLRDFIVNNPDYASIIMYITDKMTKLNKMKYSRLDMSSSLHMNKTILTNRMQELHNIGLLHRKGKEIFLNPAMACKFLTAKQQNKLVKEYMEYCHEKEQ